MNQLSKLKKKYLKFMGEKEVKSFEDKIERIFEENKYLKIEIDSLKSSICDLEATLDRIYDIINN